MALKRSRPGPLALLLLAALLAASLVPRIPLLANAERTFSSDEAVNALSIEHLLAGRELSLFGWDATYYGTVEGLLAIPFVLLLGPTALAFKLSAVLGFLALGLAVFGLGRALYGEAEGLIGLALLTVFSPQLLRWSTLAASGFCLIVAWGTLTLLYLLHLLRAPSRRLGFVILGLLAGFGFYIFELYLPYLALLLLAGGFYLGARPRTAAALRSRLAAIAAAAAGFALGAAPKIGLLWRGGEGTKRPAYSLAGAEQIRHNLRLLVHDCIPALFGVSPFAGPVLEPENGPLPGSTFRVLGALLLLAYALAWLWALVRVLRPATTPSTDTPRRTVERLLVAFVPLVALLFVISPNPQDAGSNRYLLPALSALPLAAAALVRWGRRSLPAALAAGLLAMALPALQSTLWFVDQGFLTPSLELTVTREPLRALLAVLRAQGLDGGYASYWDSYKATFLAGEKLVFVPYMGWDRYPPYSRWLRATAAVAWFFPGERAGVGPAGLAEANRLEALLLSQLASSGRPYRVLRAAGYRIYLGAGGRRPLPPPLPLRPVPLARPAVEFLAAAVPARAAAGSRIVVPIRVVNRSDAFWSAAGLPLEAGILRVAAAYRWLAPDGRVLVPEGERSSLPADVPPGGTLDMRVGVRAPDAHGPCTLRLTFVQEGVDWFDSRPGGLSDHPVEIGPGSAENP
ncbi:MAG: hypothetical protein QOJ16_3521 [Acidobacteriota bacterium]|nr:hypothetical protein [Acidobacteriota bacterium]